MNMKEQKKKRKSKLSAVQRFIEFYVQTRIYSEQQQPIIHFALISIVIILSTIQELSFLLLNYPKISNQQSSFVQFSTAISEALRIHFSQSMSYRQNSYLITLSIILLYQLLMIFMFILYLTKKKKSKKFKDFLKGENKLISLLLKIYSFFYSILNFLLFIPLSEMCLDSLIQNSRQDQMNFVNLTFSIITLALFIIDYVIQIMINIETINIIPKNFELLQINFSIYFRALCNLLIVLVDRLNSLDDTTFYLIFSITIVKEINIFWTLTLNFANLYKRTLVEIACNFIEISLAIILFCIKVSDSLQTEFDSIIILLICPILVAIAINFKKQQHNDILIMDSERLTCDMQQYKIASLLYDFQTLRQNYLIDNKKISLIHSYKLVHEQNCEDQICECHNQEITLTLEKIVILFIKDQVKIFDSLIFKVKDESLKYSYFLHYLSLINHMGMNTKAFQQSNFLLQFDSEQYQYSSSVTYLANQTIKNDKREQSISQEGKSHSLQKSKSADKGQEQGSHIKINNMGFFQKQKLQYVQDQIKQSMSMGFSKQNQQLTENLEHAVKLFLQSEDSNKKLKNKIIKMINKKREFFSNLNQVNIDFSLFKQGKQLLVQMSNLEEKLYKLYDQFPSQKMQALNAFYQSELMNNYFSAYKLATIAAISDEKLLKMQSQTSFDLFSSKIDYLIIGFNQQNHKLEIRQTSNQINQFFGCTLEQFKMLTNIDALLPSGFNSIHERLVIQFLQYGVSKYFRQINLNFSSLQFHYIKPIDFFYDINFMNLDDLTFACFLQNTEVQSAFIFCTNGNKIGGVTQNLTSKLGYSRKLSYQLASSMHKISIQKIFPKMINSIDQNPNRFVETQTQISEYQLLMYVPQVQLLENNQKVLWDNSDHLTVYNVDCIIHLRNQRQDYSYMIIEIKEAKRPMQTGTSTPITQNMINTNQEFESFSGLMIDEEGMELEVQEPKVLELYGLDDQTLDQNDQFEQSVGIRMKQHDKTLNISYIQQQQGNFSMISPKDSGLRLIEKNYIPEYNNTSIKYKRIGEQQFFCAEKIEQQDDFSSSMNKTSQIKKQTDNKIDKLQMEDIDEDLKENIRMQMQLDQKSERIVHIDDIGSQVSSIAGIKKSKYSKKYDLIERLVISKKFSKFFKLMILFFTLMCILFQVFSAIMLYFSDTDLNRFLQELDLILIKSNVIGPSNKYSVSQYCMVNYISLLLYFPNLDYTTIIQEMQYCANDIQYTYQELKDSLTAQLANPYLNPFFNDKVFDIMMGSYPATTNYSISARESLYLFLEASYNMVLINYYQIATIDPTQGFLVFLVGNYQTFVEQLGSLNQEMLSYSINRSQDVKNKWNSLLIPVLLICFLLMLISFQFFRMYLAQYDKFLALFSLIDSVWLTRDIDRYRGIVSLLSKDSDVLFKYQFDIEIKEKFLASEDIRKEKIAQNQRQLKQKNKTQLFHLTQKMSFLPSLLLFSFFFGICFIFCFITNSFGRNYFSLYPNTVDFFNTLSDLTIAVSGIFSMRELTYYQKYSLVDVFYYLPDKNATFFTQNFANQITTINNFLTLVVSFDSSKYITSNSFTIQMDDIMQQNVCQFLPEYKQTLATQHCNVVYQGVLERGFQESITFIRDSLLNEYNQTDAFNFSYKVYSTDQQLEAGLILYDVIDALKQKFQDELKTSTDDLITQIMIVNIVFLCLIILILMLSYTKIINYYKWEFNIMKRFVLLLPQQSIFLDDQLDRNLRQMIVKEELI